MILAIIFSVRKDFQIKPSFFLLSLVLFSSSSIVQPMICQAHTGGSWATSHMRMKARKERSRWHQKIRLSRSLVVKLAIWLPAGRLWEQGWRGAQHHCTGRRVMPHSLQSQVPIALRGVLLKVACKHRWTTVCSIWMATMKSVAPTLGWLLSCSCP